MFSQFLTQMETFRDLLPMYSEVAFSVTACVVVAALIFKISTRKLPTQAKVNCWFCNHDTVVPYGNRNSWDCPNCDQYNGFQKDGDYNKPIPAQYTTELNHGVSAAPPSLVSAGTLQWVNSQTLLCKKCNKNQTSKIKQLASFIPRNDENYDEEIDTYKHHLEQTYKLCRPCEAAVEYYIKYQNRQLRGLLFSHQLMHTRDRMMGFLKSFSSPSAVGVILLRTATFLICAFLLATHVSELADQPSSYSGPQTLSGGAAAPKPGTHNESAPEKEISGGAHVWHSLLALLPNMPAQYAKMVWQYGKHSQVAVVSSGLASCLFAIFLAGPKGLRRIDAGTSIMWFLILCLHLGEHYWASAPSWMDTAKVIATTLCCLVSFSAAVATRNPQSLRRARSRRYLGSSSLHPFSSTPPLLTPDLADTFIPTPPPNLSNLIKHQKSPCEHKPSPSSLPGRFSRALSFGTIPSLTKTDYGYLFSGSRPASQYKDSPSSDYFSLKSWSRPSSPAPSVAGSFTSSSSSARHRRPLISPARLNISSPSLCLFSTKLEPSLKASPPPTSSYLHEDQTSVYSGRFSPDIPLFQSQNNFASLTREHTQNDESQSSSSGSSACLVGTTTQDSEITPPPKGFNKSLMWRGLLLASLSANIFFIYLCFHNWKNLF